MKREIPYILTFTPLLQARVTMVLNVSPLTWSPFVIHDSTPVLIAQGFARNIQTANLSVPFLAINKALQHAGDNSDTTIGQYEFDRFRFPIQFASYFGQYL